VAIFDVDSTGYNFIGWRGFQTIGKESTYRRQCGETRPAIGDVDNDGRAEVAVGVGYCPAAGDTGNQVDIFDFNSPGVAYWKASIQVDWPAFRAAGVGVWPAIGNVQIGAGGSERVPERPPAGPPTESDIARPHEPSERDMAPGQGPSKSDMAPGLGPSAPDAVRFGPHPNRGIAPSL